MKKSNICSGIILDNNSRILLIKRKFDRKDFPNYWAIPGGKQEEGENIESAVIREVKEEVGLNFEIIKLFIENEGVVGERNRLLHFYRFLGKSYGTVKIQEEECDGYGWFSYKETTEILINLNMKNIFKKLNEEGLLN